MIQTYTGRDLSSRIRDSGLHTANLPFASEPHPRTATPLPFITITRQAGAGGSAIPQRLADALERTTPPDEPAWSAWDRELVEKVAAEYQIPVDVVESLEGPGHSWLDTFFSGLVDAPDESAILRRMQHAALALARRGHVVLAGHGSVFMTRSLPGGVHIRLVAPLAHRLQNVSRKLNISEREAAKRLRQLERTRRAFLRRFWPGLSLAPEAIAATFNTAIVDEPHLISAIASLVMSAA